MGSAQKLSTCSPGAGPGWGGAGSPQRGVSGACPQAWSLYPAPGRRREGGGRSAAGVRRLARPKVFLEEFWRRQRRRQLPERVMDALKSAGRALIRSPSLAKQSWAGGRHRSECVRPGSGLRQAPAKVDSAASSCPARPGPEGYVRLRLGRVGRTGVPRCGAVRTPRGPPPAPAQPTGCPLDAGFRRFLPAPRGEPSPVPPGNPASSPRWRGWRPDSFQIVFFLLSSLGDCPSPRAPRQKADSDSLPLLPSVWEGGEEPPQLPLGLLSGSLHLAPSLEARET